MKKAFVFFAASILMLMIACNESTVKVMPDEAANTIKLIDSISYNPLEGYKIELFFLLKPKPIVLNNTFSILPNPVFYNCLFQFSNIQPCLIEMAITNMVSNKELKLINFQSAAGTSAFSYNLHDSLNTEYGFYKAILKKDGTVTDSLNMLYCNAEQDVKIRRDTLYPVITELTDLNGSFKIMENIYKLVGQTFYRTAETGQVLGGYEFTNNFRIIVYDKDNKKIIEITIDVDKIKNGFNIKL
jgi:hypothetical protein